MEELTKMSNSELMLDIAMSQYNKSFIENRKKRSDKLKSNIIINHVSNYYNISIDSLKSKSRKTINVEARKVIYYLLRKHTLISLKEIGDYFGGRDHTTVIHSCESAKDLMKVYSEFETKVSELETKILEKINTCYR